MKRLILASIAVILMAPLVFGSTTLNLKAAWIANTEPDMKEYKLYRTDGSRMLIGTIQHPTTTYNFSVDIADGTEGTLTFVYTALDISGNESGDSNTAPFPFDRKAPAAPAGLSITKQ